MQKEELVNLINLGYSQRNLAKIFDKSQSTIKHWLKKYELKTLYEKNNVNKYAIDGGKKCPRCNELKDVEDFYSTKRKKGDSNVDRLTGYCKKCSNSYHTNRLKEVKIKMIRYKGGECCDCTLKLEDSHYCVFDFHHLDPSVKDPNFGRIRYQKWEKILNEIDKCVLLCSNCHRTRHSIIEGW